jgi:hypothetical protein
MGYPEEILVEIRKLFCLVNVRRFEVCYSNKVP